MTRAEKSLWAERERLIAKHAILFGRLQDVGGAIKRVDNALAALKSGER